jgi:hypothetical protein
MAFKTIVSVSKKADGVCKQEQKRSAKDRSKTTISKKGMWQ